MLLYIHHGSKTHYFKDKAHVIFMSPRKTPCRQKLNHAISDLFCTTLNDLKYQCDLSL